MSLFEQFRNGDTGTYNGVALLASLSGISYAEAEWIAKRVQQLIREGKSREEAAATVREECKAKPWEKAA